MNETNRSQNHRVQKLPVEKNEVVEYETEFADEDDVEAVERAHAADARQQNS